MKIVRSAADWFFVAGVGIAFALEVLWALHSPTSSFAVLMDRVGTWLFPCSLMLKATEGSNFAIRLGVYLMACLANGLCYYVAGFLIGTLARSIFRSR
jgi:hypothetical protein